MTGCDANVYPPMSDQLTAPGIKLIEGFGEEQIKLKPDLWVVGNVVTRNAVDDIRQAPDPQLRLQELIAGFDGDRHLRASLLDAAGNVVAESKLQPPDDPMPAWIRGFIARDAPGLRLAPRQRSVLIRANSKAHFPKRFPIRLTIS